MVKEKEKEKVKEKEVEKIEVEEIEVQEIKKEPIDQKEWLKLVRIREVFEEHLAEEVRKGRNFALMQ
jgi:hypothetical protein